MKRLIYIWIEFMVLLLIVAEAAAKDISNIYGKRGVSADSIMEKVIFFAPFYESIVNDLCPVKEVPQAVAGRKKNTKEIDMVAKLFDEIAPKYADRNGGYTRIIKIGQRKGDAAMDTGAEACACRGYGPLALCARGVD